MPVHFSSVRLPSISAGFNNLRARFAAFTGRVKSTLQSLNARSLPPVRPLQTRHVQPATPPSSSPIKQLRQADPAQADSSLVMKPPPDLKARLQVDVRHLHQRSLNQEIQGFDSAKLNPTATREPAAPTLTPRQAMRFVERQKEHAEAKANAMSRLAPEILAAPPLKQVGTVEKTGLGSVRNDQQHAAVLDSAKLQAKPLAAPVNPAQLLQEPSLSDIKPELDHLVSRQGLKDFANQVQVRLAKLATAEDKSERRAVANELDQLADDLGRVLGGIYRGKPVEQQNAFAIGIGQEFKGELWEMLRGANGKLPELVFHTGDGAPAAPAEAFVNRVYNQTALNLDNHLSGGDKPELTFNGSLYRQQALLGKGGGGTAYSYVNDEGNTLVVKTKGFGADYESGLGAEDLKAINGELRTHLGLMGGNSEGADHVLKIVGAVRTENGQPIAILELANRGDVEHLLGKPPPVGADAKSLPPEYKGQLQKAVENGSVSPHAAKLVKLLVLDDALSGMAYLQEQTGLRHGDFKPGNLFIGGDAKIKVADFGESTFDSAQQVSQGVQGTPKYMAPEMFAPDGTVTPKADTWAIGVFTHELFHGTAPFGSKDADVAQRTTDYVATGGPSGELGVSQLATNANPDAPVQGVTSLDRFLNSTLQSDPDKRPSLKEARASSLFDDLRGHEPQVRELVKALTDSPHDRARIKALSDTLGV
jgi:serine/threonine protein kinase